MEKQYITRCPKCETHFKVSLDQMNKAQGLVRCGECMHVFSADQYLQTNQPTTPSESKTPQEKQSTANNESKKWIPEIPLQIRYEETKKPLLGRMVWGSLFILGCLMLVTQVFWFERNELSQHPQLTSLYKQVCAKLDCSLTSRQDIPQIANHQLVVRDHPKYLGALAIDILMENQAPFPQPFPAIQLIFSDLNGEPKAARNIQPQEYLGGDFSKTRLMPSGKAVQVQIELIEPGAQAPNYRLQFVQAAGQI